MKNKKHTIRTRVLAVLSIKLFFTFAFTGLIFNIAAGRYIYSNAVEQLDRSFHIVEEAMEMAGTIILEFPREFFGARNMGITLRRNDFRIESNMFVLDSYYNLLGNQQISEVSYDVYNAIIQGGINISGMRNRMIRTHDGAYYISSFNMPVRQTDDSAYWVIYADVTGLSNFALIVNRFLFLLVCVMFLIAVCLSYFLSNSITVPIQKLSALAVKIGKGIFTPEDYKFKDSEFEELNTALNKSARQLGVYDSEQKTFFQNVSHEFRTPLMSIQCYAEGITCGLMEPVSAGETILAETSRLTEMVNDLLYISKIGNITDEFTYSDFDIRELINTCVSRQSALADKNNLKITLEFEEGELYFNCIVELLTRAVENLISNAIRYAKTEIIVSCLKTSSALEITVKDDGDGIEGEILPRIFERFVKGRGGNQGLGLSIVKSIAEQHGGTVSAFNVEAGGAVITIKLPLKREA